MKNIIFFNLADEVVDVCPIIPSKDLSFDWVKSLRASYVKEKNKDVNPNLYRCPGIFNIMKEGYIIPAPWDIFIKCEQNKLYFKVNNEQYIQSLMDNYNLVTAFDSEISKHIPTEEYCTSEVVKIFTGWHVLLPKDVKMLFLPIPYPDSSELFFEAYSGILNPTESTELNVQIKLKAKDGEYRIKAGTPLMQMIPLSNEKYNLIVRKRSQTDKYWSKIKKFLALRQTVPNRAETKNQYEKIIGDNPK